MRVNLVVIESTPDIDIDAVLDGCRVLGRFERELNGDQLDNVRRAMNVADQYTRPGDPAIGGEVRVPSHVTKDEHDA